MFHFNQTHATNNNSISITDTKPFSISQDSSPENDLINKMHKYLNNNTSLDVNIKDLLENKIRDIINTKEERQIRNTLLKPGQSMNLLIKKLQKLYEMQDNPQKHQTKQNHENKTNNDSIITDNVIYFSIFLNSLIFILFCFIYFKI